MPHFYLSSKTIIYSIKILFDIFPLSSIIIIFVCFFFVSTHSACFGLKDLVLDFLFSFIVINKPLKKQQKQIYLTKCCNYIGNGNVYHFNGWARTEWKRKIYCKENNGMRMPTLFYMHIKCSFDGLLIGQGQNKEEKINGCLLSSWNKPPNKPTASHSQLNGYWFLNLLFFFIL